MAAEKNNQNRFDRSKSDCLISLCETASGVSRGPHLFISRPATSPFLPLRLPLILNDWLSVGIDL